MLTAVILVGSSSALPLTQVLGAAAYNGLEIEVVETQAMKGDTKKPEYLALFPYGKIPGFKGTDGFSLIEGKAIARYGTFSFQPSAFRRFVSALPSSSAALSATMWPHPAVPQAPVQASTHAWHFRFK